MRMKNKDTIILINKLVCVLEGKINILF